MPTVPREPGPRLRAAPVRTPFHIVLVEPEIPPNTGNIGRLCAATGCPLHLVGKLGFQIDEHAVRRAGLDYWHLVEVRQHADLAQCEAALRCDEVRPSPRSWLLSGKSSRSFLDIEFQLGDALIFGKESTGLDTAELSRRPESVLGIPTLGQVRSLNLANSVSIVLFEALRQLGALNDASLR